VGTSLANQTGGEHIPESGGPAITEDDLVTIRQGKQLREALPHPTDEVSHGSLPVRGPQHRLMRDEVVDLFCSNFAGTCSKAAIEGTNVGGDLNRGHITILRAAG
jgi:hypothetical protein